MTLLEAYRRNSLELLKFSAVLAYLSASYIGSAATALTSFVVYDFAVKDDEDQKEGQGESNEGEFRGLGKQNNSKIDTFISSFRSAVWHWPRGRRR